MKRKIIAFAVACMMLFLCSDVSAGAEVIHETELEDYIMQEMSSANILGMGISIVSPDKELYCAAYGASRETQADYVLGSVSKSFTAAGIMRMVEDGDISLTDTISKYLPGYKEAADITIQELLNHTSGIAEEQVMSDLEVTGQRGQFQYSNANYNLLGEIIEEISGVTYEEFISDNILDPLEMTSTYSLRMKSGMEEELLTGYQNYFGFPYASKYQYDKEDDWIQVPSGYLISDIKDMGKYLQMYLKEGGDILSKESIDAMLYQGVETPDDSRASKALFDGSARYGMGWLEKEVYGTKILYHAGEVESFTTMMVLLPEQELGIMMMFNSMDYLVGQKLIKSLAEGIVSIELDETPAQIDGNTYLIQHGIMDFLMFLAFFASWMPIILMGVWVKHRREHLFSIPGIIADCVIHIVLPVVILSVRQWAVPGFMLKRFVPDVYYVTWGVILSLFFGGLVKIITMVALVVLGKKKETDKGQGTEAAKKGTPAKEEAAGKQGKEETEKKEIPVKEKKSREKAGKVQKRESAAEKEISAREEAGKRREEEETAEKEMPVKEETAKEQEKETPVKEKKNEEKTGKGQEREEGMEKEASAQEEKSEEKIDKQQEAAVTAEKETVKEIQEKKKETGKGQQKKNRKGKKRR